MNFFKLNKYNFRHLILGIAAITIVALTLLVAFFSSQIAFNEMENTLYQQSIHITRNMAEDSIAPLLYDSASGADDMLNTIIDMPQITEASIIRTTNNALVRLKEPEHIQHNYPTATTTEPLRVTETDNGWYFSALVLNNQNSGNLSDILFEPEETDSITLGYINVGVTKKYIYASRKNIFIRNFMVAAIAGAILLFIMYQVLKYLTRPLEKLSMLMEQGRQGNYPENTLIKGTREINDISNSFNEMIFAIKEREQNLSLTLDSIGDAVIVTDASGNVVRMNPVAEKLTGWTLNHAKTKSIKTIFPIIDAATRKPIKNPVEEVLELGETVYLSNHTTLIAKDNTEYQIADSAAPIRNEQGNILGVVLVFNDVTEQYKLRQTAAKSKRDMQAIMDNSPAVIYVKDIAGGYLFINHRFEELFNLKSEEIIGKTDQDLFPEETADTLIQNDNAVFNAGHAIETEETLPQGDGLHTYLTIKFPLYDDENTSYAICGISTDITERRKQEEQLRRSQKMDALGKLTGGVAHDYNNMLGVVMGYAELLESQLSEQPKLASFAQKIFHAGERGEKLTKKLLSFSSQNKSSSNIVNINNLLLEERDMLEKVLTARIKLQLDLDDNIKPVHLDIGELEDVIVNLCINAMHAIDNNGVLTIKSSNEIFSDTDSKIPQFKPGNYVRLSITDTGCGMDKATRDKIFEPFFTTKGAKGTGLGLAQVYGFVERNSGTIQVYSEPGQGSEFVLYFPAHNTANGSEKPQMEKSVDDYKGHESILIVDDEPALLDLASEILNQQGYRTVCAENANEALALLKMDSFDLMLSDVIMPDINGYQLAAMVQKAYPEIKIQLVSGFSDERHLNSGSSRLHEELISKPYQALTLLKRIRFLLDKK